MAVSVLGRGGKDSASARGRVRILLSDPDADLRAAVVTAVLDWKDPEFDQLLREMESHESSPEVLSVLKKGLHPLPEETPGEEKHCSENREGRELLCAPFQTSLHQTNIAN